MIVNSHNDWDPLEEIIVGHAHNSRVTVDISTRSFSYANYTMDQIIPMEGKYPQWVIDEANEDADGLANALVKLGVKYIVLKSLIGNKNFQLQTGKLKAGILGVQGILFYHWAIC